MAEKIFRLVFLIFGAAAGYQIASYALQLGLNVNSAGLDSGRFHLLLVAVGALVGLMLTPIVLWAAKQAVSWMVTSLHRTPTSDIVAGAVGLIVSLIIAILLTLAFPRNIPLVGDYLPIIFTVFMGYAGMTVAVKKKEELLNLFSLVPRSMEKVVSSREKANKASARLPVKLLDTSVIIDGRIFDICKSGFIEGALIIPRFVLEELQHIADSSDLLKRNRGRRGLDILNKMQKELNITIQIVEKDYDDMSEVDSKLVRLAKSMGGKVVTNDYNLNKVCELQGVPVLNINELANAVKPIVLPGEEMVVQVIKDGKELGQGVAYLDDGTMIVVDGGRRFIGETVGVLVTSVLQTAAGRMIFAKPKPLERAL